MAVIFPSIAGVADHADVINRICTALRQRNHVVTRQSLLGEADKTPVVVSGAECFPLRYRVTSG